MVIGINITLIIKYRNFLKQSMLTITDVITLCHRSFICKYGVLKHKINNFHECWGMEISKLKRNLEYFGIVETL